MSLVMSCTSIHTHTHMLTDEFQVLRGRSFQDYPLSYEVLKSNFFSWQILTTSSVVVS